jgi:membrane-bound metal-dependent hydrolase YbcI (DUF457 family)
MYINIYFLIGLFWLHFLGDFVCQSDQMAIHKSTSYGWLSLHVLVYTVCFIGIGWRFAVLNGAIHFLVDLFTSRGTTYLWQREKRHWFFTLIGLDQMLHLTTLVITGKLLLNH